jgi:hypothetical protein
VVDCFPRQRSEDDDEHENDQEPPAPYPYRPIEEGIERDALLTALASGDLRKFQGQVEAEGRFADANRASPYHRMG